MLKKAVVGDSELCVIKQAKIVFVGQSQTTPARTDGDKREVVRRAICIKDKTDECKLMLWDENAASVSTVYICVESLSLL